MTTSNYTPTVQGTGVKATIQRIGGFLAGMVMPNIGAFIAWGLITAVFLEDGGWLPNEGFADLIGTLINVLLPVLIGYTGGRLVHGQRGAVVGSVATIGVVVAFEDKPMILGAMVMAPLAAYLLKRIDGLIQDRIKPGFEMLVDNFTAGILGAGMALLGVVAFGPMFGGLTNLAGDGVDWLVSHHMLGLVSIIVEPAKVLFLNNAINHGVFTPLGASEVADAGKSILFMVETNPGPGIGLLLAFFFFGPRALRPTTPAAMIIQFFGGIHEVYFPYVLMKPRLILATIAGGAAGVSTYMITGAGLVSAPSPGSIFAYFAVTPKGGWFSMLLGIVIAAAVSFAVAALLLGFGRKAGDEPDDAAVTPEEQADREQAELAEARRRSADNKNLAPTARGSGDDTTPHATVKES